MLATTAAMVAFAANSLLCRQALVHTDIDPASFTTVRLASGAIALWAFVAARHGKLWPEGGTWISAAALFAYAACFSFAYLSLTAATGALLLFAAVQFTMLGYGFTQGTRLNARQSIGFTLAAIGLVILLLPGVTAPAPQGALLMVMAGIAWGCYSLRGGAHDPAQTYGGELPAVDADGPAAGMVRPGQVSGPARHRPGHRVRRRDLGHGLPDLVRGAAPHHGDHRCGGAAQRSRNCRSAGRARAQRAAVTALDRSIDHHLEWYRPGDSPRGTRPHASR
jgi:hypothetical protein